MAKKKPLPFVEEKVTTPARIGSSEEWMKRQEHIVKRNRLIVGELTKRNPFFKDIEVRLMREKTEEGFERRANEVQERLSLALNTPDSDMAKNVKQILRDLPDFVMAIKTLREHKE